MPKYLVVRTMYPCEYNIDFHIRENNYYVNKIITPINYGDIRETAFLFSVYP